MGGACYCSIYDIVNQIVRVELFTGVGGYCSMELHWSAKDTLIGSATESAWQHLEIKSSAR